MVETLQFVNLSLRGIADSLHQARETMIAADVSPRSPQVRRLLQTEKQLKELSQAQRGNGRSPVLRLGFPGKGNWEERLRPQGSGAALAVDWIDISEDLIELSETFGIQFRETAHEMLVFLEQTYAARWGDEAIAALHYIQAAVDEQPSPAGGSQKRKRKRKAPGKTAKSKGPRVWTFNQQLPLATFLARAFELFNTARQFIDTQDTSASKACGIAVIGRGQMTADVMGYTQLQAMYGKIGSQLLALRGDKTAAALLNGLQSFIEVSAQRVRMPDAKYVMSETRRVQGLLERTQPVACS